MDIQDYLIENEISQTDFAAIVGVHLITLHNIVKKGGTPSLETALKIEKASDGKVTCEDLLLIRKNKYRKPRTLRAPKKQVQIKILNPTLRLVEVP